MSRSSSRTSARGAGGGRATRCVAELAARPLTRGTCGGARCGRLGQWHAATVDLNHDLIPGEKGPQDACGVFGVWAPGEDVAKLTYFGLYALQHRGQESAGHRDR